MKRGLFLSVCLAITAVSFGQEKPVSVPVASEIPPGPSMKETEAWIKRELRTMGSDYIVTKYKDATWGTKYEIESAVLSECRLTLRTSEQDDESYGVTPKRRTQIATVTLKDVDVEKLRSMEISVVTGSTMSKPSYRIILAVLPERGDPFLLESDGYAGGKTTKSVRAVAVRVREQSMGNQVVEVFRRAAILYGAPYQSAPLSGDALKKVLGRYNEKEKSTNYIELRADGTFVMKHDEENLIGNYRIEGDVIAFVAPGIKDPLKGHLIGNTITNDKGLVGWEKPAESETSQNQTSKTASKMTNDDVVQLVAAGLSEQVIITSIRQAPTKGFDLSPTGLIALKKANVPDAVIAVMQEKPTAEQTPPASEAKTPPKYDPTLTKQTASPPQDSCSGIESLGIFKNTAIDPAIGGGVVEWLAKIRNNTNVTKIVVFGWIDMYGQQKKAQVQIRGGDIASVRLDLTQARVIPPVRDLRLLLCQ